MTQIPLLVEPDSMYLWKGIGGYFDSLDQILCEFIDNSISNFIANHTLSKTIILYFKELSDDKIFVSIEDSGIGIEDLSDTFTLESQKHQETPLNEHGFGLKHALASANPNNDTWKVCTRTKKNFTDRLYMQVSAPYKLQEFTATIVSGKDTPWPGQLNNSGTYIELTCTKEIFNTIRRGLQGSFKFKGTIDVLAEDLGFIYANLISENKASISIQYEPINTADTPPDNISVSAIEPEWEQFIKPHNGEIRKDLGGGNVTLKYKFGIIKKRSNGRKHYQKNMASSGVEIRINGRVIEKNLFQEIWQKEQHNSYNDFLAIINIVSQDRKALPTTRTSKNGIRQGDDKLENLYEWIRSVCDPSKNLADADDEMDLFEQLEKDKTIHLGKLLLRSDRELKVFKNVKENIRMDLYLKTIDCVTIYEGKKDKTTLKDIYQLMMYWDGCVLDGIQPDEGILIAATHPQSVIDMIDIINTSMKDMNNKPYHFTAKIWHDEGIDYPPRTNK